MIKKRSTIALVVMVIIVCVSLIITNLSMTQYLLTPVKAMEKCITFLNEANTVHTNSNIVFNLSQTDVQAGLVINVQASWNRTEEAFTAKFSHADGLTPEIQIEYVKGVLSFDIPGIATEDIRIIKEGNGQQKTENIPYRESFPEIFNNWLESSTIDTAITSANVLFDKPEKRDRREWVFKIQIGASMYELLDSIPEFSIENELFKIPDLSDNLLDYIEQMKNTDLLLTIITTMDMQPRLFEFAVLDETGDKILILSGDISIE